MPWFDAMEVERHPRDRSGRIDQNRRALEIS